MAQLVIPNLDENVTARLQQRARNHGRTTEEEARAILHNAVTMQATPTERLGSKLQARFAAIGLDEDIVERRGQPARPADLGG
jgi:plasmid stability protein